MSEHKRMSICVRTAHVPWHTLGETRFWKAVRNELALYFAQTRMTRNSSLLHICMFHMQGVAKPRILSSSRPHTIVCVCVCVFLIFAIAIVNDKTVVHYHTLLCSY